MLSIIIPHYNSVNSLKKLLDTIPVSNEIEIIVVDDKSTQYLPEFTQLRESEKYKHVLFLQNNTNKKGAGVCRNIGLEHITGEWVLFADTDDFFIEGFYDIVREFFVSDYDIIYFTPTSIEIDTGNESDRHVNFKKIILDYIEKKDRSSELKLRFEFPVPWSKLIRADLIKENNIKFDEILASNDVMFSTKIGYHAKKITASDKIIYCVTKNKGSLTNTISEEFFDMRLYTRIKYCKYLKARLNKNDQKVINLSGRSIIVNSITYKLGIKKLISTYIILRKNNIKVFEFKYLNPFFLLNRLKYQYKSTIRDRKYQIK